MAIDSSAVLIVGASGSGKSALALELIGLGARLISDDLTLVTLEQGVPVAHAPERMAGVIEARNVGLIHVPFQAAAPVRLVVDLSEDETERLPHRHTRDILGVAVDLQYRADARYFAAAILRLVQGGRFA